MLCHQAVQVTPVKLRKNYPAAASARRALTEGDRGEHEVRLCARASAGQSSHGLPTVAHAHTGKRERRLVSLTFVSWNQLSLWLRQLAGFAGSGRFSRYASAALSGPARHYPRCACSRTSRSTLSADQKTPRSTVRLEGVVRTCPECSKKKLPLGALIVHLNDTHHWTRERIAAWVADPDVPQDESHAHH
jgi:hypothetical protein